MIAILGAVDLTVDDGRSHLGVRLRAIGDRISTSPVVVGALFSLSVPDEPPLLPSELADQYVRRSRIPSGRPSGSRKDR